MPFTVCELGTILANRVLTYGWHRAEVLGALISIEAIWVMTAILVYSGGFHFRWLEIVILRFQPSKVKPHLAINRIRSLDFEIQSHTMVTLSCCAILVNIA